jgi:glycosyltransferase involved in cell wall biosynthesis
VKRGEPAGAADPPVGPVRVAVIITRYLPAYSGAAMQQHDILTRLGPSVDATVLTLPIAGSPRRETTQGVRILRLGSCGNPRLARALYSLQVVLHLLAAGREYHLLHAIGAGWASALVPLLGRLLGVPTVFTSTLRGSDDPASIRSQRLGGLKTRLMRLYRVITANTPDQVRSFADAGYPAETMLALPCGVDDRVLVPGPDRECRRELRRSAGRDDEGPVVLFVGTLVRRKGVDLLLESFRRLLARHPAAVLVLMGPRNREEDFGLDEAFVESLRLRSESAELRSHVVFLGMVTSPERKRSVLQASDVLALFSENEGLGIVVLEAMACGVPPVLTPLPGVFDHVVEDGVNGRIASSRCPEDLCNALDEVLSSDARREAMGREARNTITRRFSLDRIAREYSALYRRLAAGGG